MSPKRQRLFFAFFGVGFLTAATLLVMNAFSEHLVFFYTPADLATQQVEPQQLVRIGGLVEEGSVEQKGAVIRFTITDLTATLPTYYEGIPPALFREGQGVVAEGYLENGGLRAVKLLAKHDENYMPPEVAEALRKSGRWQHASDTLEGEASPMAAP